MIDDNINIDSFIFNDENIIDFENNIQSHFELQKNKLSFENSIFNEEFLNKKIKTNSFETNFFSLNEDEIKRKNKLKKNAESAKRARQRKKELMNNLIQENVKLKSEIKELKKILENKICDKCKNKIFHSNNIINNTQNNNNNNNNNSLNKKKIFIFSTISLSFILLIFINVNIINQKTNLLRNLNIISNELSNSKYTNLEIQNLTLTSVHVLFGDYYSLIKRKYNFLYNENNIIYSFQNKGKVRILKENEINEDLNIENCKDCIVELNQDNVILKKSENGIQYFKIVFTPKKINIDGNDFDINSGKNGLPVFSYEIDCRSFGFSKNLIYNNDYN